ncbi:MAG: hypothetical protein ACKVZ0_03645 [Gemmatimonadales bacterium]
MTLTATGVLTWRAWRTEGPTVVRDGPTEALAAPASVVPPVRLVWRSVPNALTYRLEVIDDAGAEIVSTTLPDTSLVLAPGQVTAGVSNRWWIEVSFGAGGSTRSEVRRFTVNDRAGRLERFGGGPPRGLRRRAARPAAPDLDSGAAGFRAPIRGSSFAG